MTTKELMKTFTHPMGIHQDHQVRQSAIENIFYQLYESAGLPYPKVYGFKSPHALQLAINYQGSARSKVTTDKTFCEQYPNFVREVARQPAIVGDLNTFFWEYIYTKIIKSFPPELKKVVTSVKGFTPYTNFCDNLNAEVEEVLKRDLSKKNLTFYPTANHPNFRDIGWISLYAKYMDWLDAKSRALFVLFMGLVKNGLMYAYYFNDTVLWCPLPEVLELDDFKQLHAAEGPAVKWEDGFGMYFWRGVKVKKRLIEFPESINRLDFLNEQDPDIRHCMREKLGPIRLASLFELLEVDSDLDENGNRNILYRTTHRDDLTGKPYYFARLYHLGHFDKKCFVEVSESSKNVWQAMSQVFPEGQKKSSEKGIKV